LRKIKKLPRIPRQFFFTHRNHRTSALNQNCIVASFPVGKEPGVFMTQNRFRVQEHVAKTIVRLFRGNERPDQLHYAPTKIMVAPAGHFMFARGKGKEESKSKPQNSHFKRSVMEKRLYAFVCLFVFITGSCKKHPVGNNQPPVSPIITGKGIAAGPMVTKTIGAAGGELATLDGKAKMIIPAGAVATNTDFAIQPITNTLFDDDARVAYRLMPEGTTFSKPVQLRFEYNADDTLNTTEDALTVATQRSDGAWTVVPAILNKTQKSLTVETTHFSDWTVTGGVYLHAASEMRVGEKQMIEVVSVWDDGDVLAPLGPTLYSDDRTKIESIDNWRIASGIGSIGVETGQLGKMQTEAEYGAPADMSQNKRTMVITVDVKGYNLIKDPTAPAGVRRLNKMILVKRITVIKEFLKVQIAGATYEFKGDEAVALVTPGGLTVGGRNDSLNVVILISGSTAGTYNCNLDNGIQANFLLGAPRVYSTGYTKCLGAGAVYSGAPIEIKKLGEPGEWVEGKFSGALFDNLADPCAGPMPTVAVNIEFNMFRSH
jgi:hypothetical protein